MHAGLLDTDTEYTAGVTAEVNLASSTVAGTE